MTDTSRAGNFDALFSAPYIRMKSLVTCDTCWHMSCCRNGAGKLPDHLANGVGHVLTGDWGRDLWQARKAENLTDVIISQVL